MNSLGREPQVQGNQKTKSPGGAADSVCSVSCSQIRTFFCRRSAAGYKKQHATWGSRPRLFICRRSAAHSSTKHSMETTAAPWMESSAIRPS